MIRLYQLALVAILTASLYGSADAQNGWTKISNDAFWGSNPGIAGLSSLGSTLLASQNTNTYAPLFYTSTDSGSIWTMHYSGLPSFGVFAGLTTTRHAVVALMGANVYRSTDVGASWAKGITGLPTGYLSWTGIVNKNDTLYACLTNSSGTHTFSYRSVDEGANWANLGFNSSDAFAIGFAGDTLYIGTQYYGVYKATTVPPGSSWTNVSSGLPLYIGSLFSTITWIASSGNAVFATTATTGLYRTLDGGAHWTTIDPQRPGGKVETIGSVVFWESDTLFTSTDRGETWRNVGTEIGTVTALYQYGEYFYAATTTGIYRRAANSIVTAVKEPKSAAPAEYRLSQNYPNPFNPSTVIRFTAPITGQASVRVYSVLGEPVETLFDGMAEAGREYSLPFDAAGIGSGVYFYKLNAPGYSEVKRMLFLR